MFGDIFVENLHMPWYVSTPQIVLSNLRMCYPKNQC